MRSQAHIEKLLARWEEFLKKYFHTTEDKSLVQLLTDIVLRRDAVRLIESHPQLVQMLDDPRIKTLVQFPPTRLPALSDEQYIDLFEPIAMAWNYGINVDDQVAIMRALLKDLENPSSILDIGCGACSYLVFLKRERVLRAKSRAVGLDASPTMLAGAKQLIQSEGVKVSLHQGWANALPFEDESFQQVICVDMLNLSEAWIAVLSEIARVTQNGGRIFVCYGRFSMRRIISADEVIKILSKSGIDVQNVYISTVGGPNLLRSYITGAKQKSSKLIIVPETTGYEKAD